MFEVCGDPKIANEDTTRGANLVCKDGVCSLDSSFAELMRAKRQQSEAEKVAGSVQKHIDS